MSAFDDVQVSKCLMAMSGLHEVNAVLVSLRGDQYFILPMLPRVLLYDDVHTAYMI